jgi:two-component system chemotaxis response regulator CheY
MGIDRSISILVVDDFTTMSRIVRSLLERCGFKDIQQVHDGNAALETLKTKKVSLVISDLHMTPIGGLELLRRMRLDSTLKDVRFVAMTADAHAQVPTAVRAMGADGLLVKPFSAETLNKVIEQAFARPSG